MVTSAGLPNTPIRKRRPEVSYNSDPHYPKAGYFRQPLTPSDSNYQGTSHSSSGESTETQLPTLKTFLGELCFKFTFNTLCLPDVLTFMFVLLSAKPRPSKKAPLNKPSDDNVTIEPEKTPEPEEANADAMLDDLPPQDHDFVVEQVEVDPTGHADKPTSPVRTADKPSSPVKLLKNCQVQ